MFVWIRFFYNYCATVRGGGRDGPHMMDTSRADRRGRDVEMGLNLGGVRNEHNIASRKNCTYAAYVFLCIQRGA